MASKANQEGPMGTLRAPEIHVDDLYGALELLRPGFREAETKRVRPGVVLRKRVARTTECCVACRRPIMPGETYWERKVNWQRYSQPMCETCADADEPVEQLGSAQEIWEAVLGELKLRVTGSTYRTWLEKTSGLSYQGNQFVVGVPNTFVAEYLDRNQRSLVEKTLVGFTHPGIEAHFQEDHTCRAIPETTATTTRNESRPPHSVPSTQEYIDKFLKAKEGKLRPDSIKSYSAVLRPFARAYPELPLGPEQIEAYLGNFSHEKTTAQYKFSVLRTFYLWLSRRNLITVNPIKMMEKPGGQADEVLPLSEEQVRLLHDMPKTDRERGYVGLMLDHGLRLSEVTRLNVGDIHEDRIWVQGKERKEWFPLLSEVRDWLLDLAGGRDSSQPLFAGRQGRLSDSQVQVDVRRLLQRGGINGVRQSPHTLRHTFSTMAYLAGCDWDAAELLLRQREKKRNVTNRYIHLSPEQRLRLVREKLEKYSPLRIISELGEEPDFTQLAKAPGQLIALTEGHSDASVLIQLLDSMAALGEAARVLKCQLGGNDHRPEKEYT